MSGSDLPPVPMPRRVSLDDYLAAEAVAETRSEFLDGVVRAMPGGSPRHYLIESQLNVMAGNRLGGKGGCVYLNGNVPIPIPRANVYTYPDGVIACPPRFAEKPRGALLNPKAIFEVLLPLSTEAYDRGAKFRRYRTLDTLEDYVLISTSEPLIEVFSRPDWGPKTYEGLETIAIVPSIGIELPLAELYAMALALPE